MRETEVRSEIEIIERKKVSHFSRRSSVDSLLSSVRRSRARFSFWSSTQNSSTLLFRYTEMSAIAEQEVINNNNQDSPSDY